MFLMNTFAKWLNEVMDKMGFTQESLGAKVGVTHVTVSKWQRSKHLPDPITLSQLATVTGEHPIRLFQIAGYLPNELPDDTVQPMSKDEKSWMDEFHNLTATQKKLVLDLIAQMKERNGKDDA